MAAGEKIKSPNRQPLSEVEVVAQQQVGQPGAVELGGGPLFTRMARRGDWRSMIEFGGVLFNTDRSPENLERQRETPN